jgi:hypothetical protein
MFTFSQPSSQLSMYLYFKCLFGVVVSVLSLNVSDNLSEWSDMSTCELLFHGINII